MTSLITFSFFIVTGLGLVFSTLVGLPGGWLMIMGAILLENFDVSLGLGTTTFGWGMIALSGGIQILSEVVEFAAGAMGAKYGGASKRGMWAALIGGIFGAILGTFLIPIPLFGSLFGSIGGSFGAAFIVEKNEIDNSTALKSATGAALGRTIGALSKVGLSLAILVLLSSSMAWNYFF
jgi:uncharacterized protein